MADPTQAGTGASVATIAGAGAVGVAVLAGAVAFVMLRGTPPGDDSAPSSAAVVTSVEVPPAPDAAAPDTALTDTPADPSPDLAETVGAELSEQLVPDAPVEASQTDGPPRFDLVRIDPTGSAVIAGRAGALSEVTLTLDGEAVEVVSTDAGGQFVALLALAPSDAPRVLTIESVMPDGARMSGEESVIIAPFVGEAMAAMDLETVARPPEPPPATRTEPPRLGEATSTPPLIAGGDADAVPDGAPAAGLPDATEDALPLTETTPPPAATATPQDPASADPAQGAQTASVTGNAGDTPEPAPAAPPSVAEAEAPPQTTPLAVSTDPTLPPPPTDIATGAAPADPAPDTVPQGTATAPGLTTPEAPGIFLADRDGIRVLQSPGAPPQALTELQLDAISYDLSGAVTLSGRGDAATSVRVTLNNQPINLGEIGPGGQWSLDLPDVDPGTYTLRLQEVAADGTVTDEIETPFLREDPARIRANPMLVDPGASVITVQRGFTLWGIAEANFGEGVLYVQIFDQNRDAIRNPDLIFPGQIFALPDLPRVADETAGDSAGE